MQKQNHGKKSKKPSLISIEPGNDDDLMSLKKIKKIKRNLTPRPPPWLYGGRAI